MKTHSGHQGWRTVGVKVGVKDVSLVNHSWSVILSAVVFTPCFCFTFQWIKEQPEEVWKHVQAIRGGKTLSVKFAYFLKKRTFFKKSGSLMRVRVHNILFALKFYLLFIIYGSCPILYTIWIVANFCIMVAMVTQTLYIFWKKKTFFWKIGFFNEG